MKLHLPFDYYSVYEGMSDIDRDKRSMAIKKAYPSYESRISYIKKGPFRG